jgi:hydrogenase small subunit
MAQEVRDGIYDLLAARGVSRRDFVKYCGSVAAMLGLSEMYAPQIAAAVEAGAKLKPTVWLDLGLCTGCTESLAQVDTPDVATIVLDLLSVNYMETISAAAGKQTEEAKAKTIEEGGYILIVEGTVMTGEDGNTLRIAGKTGLEILKEAAAGADYVVCVGSCAVDGGWVRANPNPAGGMGVLDYMPELKPKTINLPTCPVNPEWIVAMVIDVLILGKVPAMDAHNRPTLIFGSSIHDNCPRRGHFENGEFVEQFGTEAEVKQWCLYKVGCKGPQTFTNCPSVRWNRRASWCVESGSPCIGCGNLNWVDNDAPFLERMPAVGGIRPETIGTVLGGAAAAGLLVHGVASATSGRLKGAPTEKEKAYDAKQKGGDK